MTKFTHTVIAEMVDVETGERKFPGEGFTPHDDDQAKRLIAADCLKEGAPPKASSTEDDAEKEAKPATAKPAAAKPAAKAPAKAAAARKAPAKRAATTKKATAGE